MRGFIDPGKKNAVALSLAWVYVFYAAIDIIHYLRFRIINAPSINEFPYEGHWISYLKWTMCLLSFIVLYLHIRGSKLVLHISWTISFIILILFFFKGQFPFVLKGSIVFQIGLLEIVAIATIAYCISVVKRLNSSWLTLLAGICVAGVIYVTLLRSLPNFIMLDE